MVGQPIIEVRESKNAQFSLPDGSLATLLVAAKSKEAERLRTAAHEFNNVLMAISPWAETLKRKFPNEDIIQKATAAIAQAIQKGRRITEEMREAAKP